MRHAPVVLDQGSRARMLTRVRREPAADALGGLLASAVASRRMASPALAAGGPVLARKWHGDNKPAALPKPNDCHGLDAKIEEYDTLPGDIDPTFALGLLHTIRRQAVGFREKADPERKRLRANVQQASGRLNTQRAQQAIDRFEQLQAALGAVVEASNKEDDVVRYGVQSGAARKALSGGALKYLNITPAAGALSLATGKEGRYPSTMALDKQYRLAAPDLAGLEVHQSGVTIDLLVISGGHGGVGSTFETGRGGLNPHYELAWWKDQITSLADKKVTAKLIVLDACLTASMVPAFLPILAGGGKIVGYVHSIPQMAMSGEMWTKVHKQSAEEIEESVSERLEELVTSHSVSRHGTPLEHTTAVAVYRDDTKTLYYDARAVDQGIIDELPEYGKEKGELQSIKRNLIAQKGVPLTGFAPTLKALTGTPAVVANRVVLAAEWGSWGDVGWLPLDDEDIVMEEGMTVQDLSGEHWEIVSFVTGVSMTIKKK